MEIVEASEGWMESCAALIPDLIHSTGPPSYDYHFGDRELFDNVVRRSWQVPGSLFSADATRLAVDGDELLGIEIGFHGPEFNERKAGLQPVWNDMLMAGETTEADLHAVAERSEHASWLNPVVRPGVYYIHALAVRPQYRGRKVGYELLTAAIARGRWKGCRTLELDVLSNNPAIGLYQSMKLELLVESRAPKPQAHGVPPEWRMGRFLAG